MALGIWLLVTLAQSYGPSQIFHLASDTSLYRNSAILLIAMGCFILFVTIFGLVAAIRESAILLTIYAVLLFIIFAGEIAGGVVAIVYKDKILDSLQGTLYESLQFSDSSYYESKGLEPNQCKSSPKGQLWDYVQLWFGCCGIGSNIRGYERLNATQLNQCNATKLRWGDLRVPLTCCKEVQDYDGLYKWDHQEQYVNVTFNCTKTNEIGCTDKMKRWIVVFAPVLIGIGIGFGMLQLFGFIFVVCLCMNTEKGFKRF